ncbi:MAG: hypothetical protein M3Y07_14130 [Acidobacteriota bacterium]|nr:hypothetical protein [Acidobacteriota bacterium]
MKVGAERKKMIALGVFGAIALIVLYMNVFSGPSYDNAPSARPAAAAGSGLAIPASPRAAGRRGQAAVHTNLGTFHPRVGSARPEERPNLAGIDPTLRLDLLAKVQQVPPAGGARNLFQFSTAETAAATAATAKLAKEPKIAINNKAPVGPVVPPGPPKPPPPPTITLKYYGYSTVRGGDGKKRAFFLDGDDIIVAGENDLIKKRYKIVKIGVNSVDVEDTQYQNVQKLPLQEESLG